MADKDSTRTQHSNLIEGLIIFLNKMLAIPRYYSTINETFNLNFELFRIILHYELMIE